MLESEASCILCRIVAGEIPASVVHRDGMVTALLDIRPIAPGHLLVMPDDHHASLADVPAATWAQVVEVARRLAAALRASKFHPAGINLLVADGEVAGQEVPHLHLHVVPRSRGDGFRMDADAWRTAPPSREELDRQAEAIRAVLIERS